MTYTDMPHLQCRLARSLEDDSSRMLGKHAKYAALITEGCAPGGWSSIEQ